MRTIAGITMLHSVNVLVLWSIYFIYFLMCLCLVAILSK